MFSITGAILKKSDKLMDEAMNEASPIKGDGKAFLSGSLIGFADFMFLWGVANYAQFIIRAIGNGLNKNK